MDAAKRAECNRYRDIASDILSLVRKMKHSEAAESLRLLAMRCEMLDRARADGRALVGRRELKTPAGDWRYSVAHETTAPLMYAPPAPQTCGLKVSTV